MTLSRPVAESDHPSPQKNCTRWLWDRCDGFARSLLIAAIGEGSNQVARGEIAVGVPIAGGPGRIADDTVFVFTGYKDVGQIRAVEFAIQIGVAEPRVFDFRNPGCEVDLIDHVIACDADRKRSISVVVGARVGFGHSAGRAWTK